MNRLVTAFTEGIIAFVATNIDDLLILLLFFSQVDVNFRPRHIVIGQYLGFIKKGRRQKAEGRRDLSLIQMPEP